MNILSKLSSQLGQRGEKANIELAKNLVENPNIEAINELVENLWNRDTKIASDCIKTLYEIGYLKPELIADYAIEFIKLLDHKHNRLVWGGMIALSTIADLAFDKIFEYYRKIQSTMENGSVITRDAGVKTLAILASKSEQNNSVLFPYLIKILKTCRPKEVPQYAESTFISLTDNNKKEYIAAITERQDIMTATQNKRIDKLLKKL